PRDRVTSAPTIEGRPGVGLRRQRHHGPALVRGRAGRPAVDLAGAGGTGTRGHGAATTPRLADRRREPLPIEDGDDRPRRAHGHGTGRARGRVTSVPTIEGGPGVGLRRQSHDRAVVVRGRAGRPAVDLAGGGGTGARGHGAATTPRLPYREATP